jgi:cobalamin biosynthesis protein CbiG
VTKFIWIGLGCQRHTPLKSIEQAITQSLAAADLSITLVAGIATSRQKATEPGVLSICAKYDWLLRLYAIEELKQVVVTNPSIVVQKALGTASVAEAAATLAAGQANNRRIYRINDRYLTVAIGLQPF